MRYAWLGRFIGGYAPGTIVTFSVLVYIAACIIFCIFLFARSHYQTESDWWYYIIHIKLILIMAASKFSYNLCG